MSRRPPNPMAAAAANGSGTPIAASYGPPGPMPASAGNLTPAGSLSSPAMRMSPSATPRQLMSGVPVMMMQGGSGSSPNHPNGGIPAALQQQQAAAMRNSRISSLRIVTMDGYPPEYLFHLHPMLGIIRPEPNLSSPMISARSLHPRQGSNGSETGNAAAAATLNVNQPGTPMMNPNPGGGRARPAGFHQRSSSLGYTSGSRRQDQLIAALQARSREVIWDPIGRVGPFRVVTFDRRHKFEKNKVITDSGPHSPLSPRTPSSPVYPDGIIHLEWLRRYREKLPSVALSLFELYDRTSDLPPSAVPPSPGGRVQSMGPGMLSGATEVANTLNTERHKDMEIIKDLLEEKKKFADLGVKYAVILILGKGHMTETNTDERLSAIKRASGLDTRSLFVLAPGGPAEMQTFVNTVYKTLQTQEVGSAFYRELSRKVKKRRTRVVTQANTLRSGPQELVTSGSVLPPEAWTVRYDIKMGILCEFSQDFNLAVRHYTVAYRNFVELLSEKTLNISGNVLFNTNTQRWQEIRILLDMISFKICKLHLYAETPVAAVGQFHKHLANVRALTEARELGCRHFKHLTWETRQYRLFGELVEIAIKNGFRLPMTAMVQLPNNGGPAIDPDSLLQHPGFYYHAAAMCIARRRRNFLESEKEYNTAIMASADKAANYATVLDPTFAEALEMERGVDHSAMAVELLTKSYEQFKRFRNVRMTLYLASEIANEYYEAGKYDMAIKFFDRIAKTYRKERWYTVLQSILLRSLDCARPLGMWNRVIEYLIELLSDYIPVTEKDRERYQNELFDLLNRPLDEGKERQIVKIEMDQICSFLTSTAVFRYGTTFSGVAAPFQVALITTPNAPIQPIRFNAIRIHFNNNRYDYCLVDDAYEQTTIPESLTEHGNTIQWIDCATTDRSTDPAITGPQALVWTKKVDLSIRHHLNKVFEGTITPLQADDITVINLEAILRFPAWEIVLNLKPDLEASRRWILSPDQAKSSRLRFIALDGSTDRTALRVMRRQPKFEVQIDHPSPAYLDEYYPLTVKLINSEADTIQATISAELKMIGTSEPNDVLTMNPSQTASGPILQRLEIGSIDAGATKSAIIYMRASRITGERSMQLRVRYQLANHDNTYDKGITTIIDVVQPLVASFEAFPLRQLAITSQPSSVEDAVLLKRQETDMLVVRVCCNGPWDIEVNRMELNLIKPTANEATIVKLLADSTHGDHFKPQVWMKGQVFQANYLLQMSTPNMANALPNSDVGSISISWRRRVESKHSDSDKLASNHWATSQLIVPPVQLDAREVTVVAEHPAWASVHEPFTLCYRVRNPTARLEELSASMETADGFVFAGMRQTVFRVLPMSTYCLRYNLYPLRTGRLRLPRLRLQGVRDVTRDIKVLGQDSSVDGMTLFVMPSNES